MRAAMRVLAALLAVVGASLALVSGWSLIHVGAAGRASFAADTPGAQVVVIGPDVTARLDVPTQVRVEAATAEDDVVISVAAPSDVAALLADHATTEITGVSLWPWRARQIGHEGAPVPDLATVDIWQTQTSGAGTSTLSLDPTLAPQSLVVFATSGTVASVTLTWTDRSWFFDSLLLVLGGLAFLASAAVVLRFSRRSPRATRNRLATGEGPCCKDTP